MPATSVAGAVTTALILLPLQLTTTEFNEPLNPLLSLPPHQGSVVLCALCASVVLFPYTTVYCLILPPLRINRRAAQSSSPPVPLQCPSSSVPLRLCGWVSESRFNTEAKRYREFSDSSSPMPNSEAPYNCPAPTTINHRYAKSSFLHESPSRIRRPLCLCGWVSA